MYIDHLVIANNSGMIPSSQPVSSSRQIGLHLKVLTLCDLALVQCYAIGQWPSLVYPNVSTVDKLVTPKISVIMANYCVKIIVHYHEIIVHYRELLIN